MKFNKRKFWAVFFIILQLFLIFAVLKNYWAETKVKYLEKEVFTKEEFLDPAVEELLQKLRDACKGWKKIFSQWK